MACLHYSVPMRLSFLSCVFLAFLPFAAAYAQPAAMADPGLALPYPDDPVSLLGMTPRQAIELFGAPARVFAVRGEEAWQDDVVFDYGGGFSLFLFMDRVWQVRIAEANRASVRGIALGSAGDQATSILGAAVQVAEGTFEWAVSGEAWPVRLRGLTDDAGIIRDMYVYRADF